MSLDWQIHMRGKAAKEIGGRMVTAAVINILIFGSLALIQKAKAHDAGDPNLSLWTMQQTNQNNGNCCNGDDVFVLGDNEWRINGDHYEALPNGQWIELPSSPLIKD